MGSRKPIKKNSISHWFKNLFKRKSSQDSDSLFFDKAGNQKKWFVISGVALPLVLTIIFSIWGTIISVKSYNLSVETSKNREQLDSTKVIIDEIRNQNKLLITQNSMLATQIKQLADLVTLNRTSTNIQEKHLETVLTDMTNFNTPKLSANLVKSEPVGEGAFTYALDYYIQVSNNGGDIYNFRCAKVDTSVFDISNFPKNGSLPRNSYFEFDLMTTKTENKYSIKFNFEDMYRKRYAQELIIYISTTKNIHNVQMGKAILR